MPAEAGPKVGSKQSGKPLLDTSNIALTMTVWHCNSISKEVSKLDIKDSICIVTG
jgi:hypothetical protein